MVVFRVTSPAISDDLARSLLWLAAGLAAGALYWLLLVTSCGFVYLPLFWLGNLDHSSYPCSWGSGHVPLGCPPAGGRLDPLYVCCLW